MQVTLSFVRHAKVPSHEGDMALTPDALTDIAAAVPGIAALGGPDARFLFLATRTSRSRQTAEALRAAIAPDTPEVTAAWGLRNPDLYLAGNRIEMMSTAEAIAAQTQAPEVSAEIVGSHPFFRGFLSTRDRIGYWLTHQAPPGETAAAVGRRVIQFAESYRWAEQGEFVVVCVTHSPVLRALIVEGLGLTDPGEPGWVESVTLQAGDTGLSYAFRDQSGTVGFITPTA